jgi:predicted TIM-barrel fold metal-dependent hydrolase
MTPPQSTTRGDRVIDWHSHWIPPGLAAEVARHRKLPPAPEFFDVEARLRQMDAGGIERQVISWPTTFGFDALLPIAEAAAFYQKYNALLGELVTQRPDRFSGLAAVPTADPEAATAELARARTELGLMGAVVPADAFLTVAGAELYTPLLAAAQRLSGHLYVHPGPTGLPVAGHAPIEFLRVDSSSGRWLLEAGTRLGAAAFTLETSGILDSYPSLTVHVAMLGGHLAWIAETLREQAQRSSNGRPLVSPLKRIFVDTGIMKPGGRELALAVSAFGAKRILFGSDFPLFGTQQPNAAFRHSDLDGDTQRMILVENGRQLLSRKV